MRVRFLLPVLCLALLVGLGFAARSQAQSIPADPYPFVVKNFRVVGARRISPGTIYNYLPIQIGDTLTRARVADAVRALFATGFFRDVELRADGSTLIIAVLERPSIEEFTFDGNKDIKDKALKDVLRKAGLTKGKTFDRSVLEELTKSLTQEYYARGKYNAQIKPTVEKLPDNRVRIHVEIAEGERAKIRDINIVGNHAFSDKELLDQFKLSTGGLFSFIRNNDRYSKEDLQGDLETLRSYYMDRGYADFHIDNTQVSISPDKRDIYITIGIKEGEQYTFGDIKLAGRMVVPEHDLKVLIRPQTGGVFSQRLLTNTVQAMRFRLGRDGYAFADIQPVPELNKDTKTVDVTFYIDPKNRVYVHRIKFTGTSSINDEVLRREVRQLEGGYLSNAKLQRSKVRLQRLPYLKSVDYETQPVPGSPDLVDLNFKIEEGQPGQFGGSIGYSKAYGVMLGGNFIHSDFLGTGNRVAVNLSGGAYRKSYSASYTNPYSTINGLSRTVSVRYQDIKQFTSFASQFSTTTLGAGVNWQYPLSEVQYVRVGVRYQDAELLAGGYSSLQAHNWVKANGDTFTVPNATGIDGTGVRTLSLNLGWILDTRNRTLFPDSGLRTSFNLSATTPGSQANYYIAQAALTKYFRLPGAWRIRINSRLAYGHAFGDTTSLPPYRNFFAGGPRSIRGYKESKLGPRDSRGNPYGGNLLVTTQLGIILPLPEKFGDSARASLFYDIGNVFSTGDVKFYDRLGNPVDYGFDASKLKRSFGLSVQWLAPLGMLTFSYAVPVNAAPKTPTSFGDEVERFQFNIGRAF